MTDVSQSIKSVREAETAFIAGCDTGEPLEWFGRLTGNYPYSDYRYTGSHMGVPCFEKLDQPRD